ncbi:cell division protein FtsB [Chitiniphilus shinanonensis]|uniref:Cell division protein FtsB n=1 Tax=Chitiniphilus shinanonensis TaxID=553088 RepID=A0ABQ6BVI1_9NEIS|nr:cell division protein FtsB [Chitiniphilus shinanonensis]GLS05457.1 cell division protein FtsB [Chitiniphilus shinanonensis]
MRILAIVLALVIALLQWPLWVGKGSWLRVWQLDQELAEKKTDNDKLRERNSALAAEVQDLKTGSDAIEERARNELGMIRKDEVFFQILDRSKPVAPSVAPAPIDASKPASVH